MKTKFLSQWVKKLPVVLGSLFLITHSVTGQTSVSPPAPNAGQPALQAGTYQIAERDANSQVWQRIDYEITPDGRRLPHVHKYTELATGLNHLVNGKWVASKEGIDILPNGTATATNGQHQAYFPGDIAQGVIELDTPDGLKLQSRPIGLSYDDGSKTVLIAILTNSTGELAGSNQVIYPNAFEGADASLRYTYKKSGFEQDIVVQSQLPPPEAFGLNPATARLQVLTEFFGNNNPAQTAGPVNRQDGLSDTTLKFGQMEMIRGRAFSIGDTNRPNSRLGGTLTYKSWMQLQGRTFLVEELPYRRITAQLQTLPTPVNAPAISYLPSSNSHLYEVSTTRLLPPANFAKSETGLPRQSTAKAGNQKSKMIKQLAKADFNLKRGVVLDYVEIDSGDTDDVVFEGGATYFINGDVIIDTLATFEGGTVVKFANGGGGFIEFGPFTDSNAIQWDTTPYRPAIFTSMDDNTVGETIDGSSGNPTTPTGTEGYYIWLPGSGDSPLTVAMNARFSYASLGIAAAPGCDLWNCQFVKCYYSISPNEALDLHNVLFSQCGEVVTTLGNDVVNLAAENITVDQCNAFSSTNTWSDPWPVQAFVTNSIFANTPKIVEVGSSADGLDNGFYNSPEFGDTPITNTVSPFQTGISGNFYLPAGSPFIDVGNTTADRLGLYWFTSQTNQAIEAISTVDLGYHYPAVDTNGNPVDTEVAGTPDYLSDQNGNGLPDSWETNYFGNLIQAASDYDSTGTNTLLYDYTNSLDPNIIQFTLQFTNYYVNTTNAPAQLIISGGVPSYIAMLVNDVNQSDAVWQPYTSSNIVATLGSTNGTYIVFVGLRGLPPDATQTWHGAWVTLYSNAPMLTITNPITSTVSQSLIQLQGYAGNPLDSLTFDVSNAAGILTNQAGFLTGQFYDTNLFAYTTNYFECSGIALDNGTNTITLHATDWAGNTANVSFTLDYSPDTNPPVLNLIWPQDGTTISGSNFTLQAQVSDPAATITASINGNAAQGLVEQNGSVWVKELSLNAGTNAVSLMVSNAFGGVSVTSFNVIGYDVGLVINPLTGDQLNQPSVNVTGSINDPSDTVTVNGMQASVDPDTGYWEADGVQVNPTGTASLSVQVGDSSNNPLALQTANQPQPAMVVLAGYSGFIYRSGTYHSDNTDWPYLEDHSINWAFDTGGNEPSTYVGPNDAQSANITESSAVDLPADGPGFTTSGLSLMWDYFSVNVPLDGGGYFRRSSKTQLMIAFSGQESAGTTNVYLVLLSALEYTDPVQDFGDGPGDVPHPPEWTKINGQTLVNTGITNEDGSVMGALLVSAVGGEPFILAPDFTQFYGYKAASVSDTQVMNLTLQIINANTGANLSAQTNTVIVGQQMNLTCQLSVTNQFMTNFPLANFHWTVPGYAISNYVVAPDASSAMVITNFPLNNSNVVFYWVDGGVKQVQCSAIVNGKIITGQAVFSVNRPVPNFSVEVSGIVAADTNYSDPGLWLHFGKNIGNDVGIAMSLTNVPTVPSGDNLYGAYFITQIIDAHFKRNVTTGTNIFGWQLDRNGLDNQIRYGNSIAIAMADLSNNPLWTDSPGITFGGPVRWVFRNDSFKDYLMFQPFGTHSIAVPIYLATWGWSGSAKTNGVVDEGILLSYTNSIPTVSPTNGFPQWTILFTNNAPWDFTNLPSFDEN